MNMQIGERYRCINDDCRCEIEVVKASAEAVLNLRCCCGAKMKKPYTNPVLDAQPMLDT